MTEIQPRTRRRIGLLGGSFNPPHDGHREISIAALERLGLDAVWWLVTPGNPLKDPTIYAPFDERVRMARRLADHPDIIVSDFEARHGTQYTVDTLERVKSLNPDTDFVWIMGADSLAGFHQWRDWKHIAELVPMAVFARPGFDSQAVDSEAASFLASFRRDEAEASELWRHEPPAWIFFSDTANPTSSTVIRQTGDRTIALEQPDLHAPFGKLSFYLDLHPSLGDFKTDAIRGLSKKPKSISPKYFYDEAGSRLFDKITTLKEYYPTRVEKSVFLGNAGEITGAVKPRSAIFEYGSGSSEKVEWLVNGAPDCVAYVAMDISKDHLIESAKQLADVLPVPVAAVCADFHTELKLPTGALPPHGQWLGYFPGSTIGNMTPDEAASFLTRASKTLGSGSQFLLGVDLEKDIGVLEAAYDDAEGVTAAFNLNLLQRMQRELGADLRIEDFEHWAFYNQDAHRIEMHLRAVRTTTIKIDNNVFEFDAGETLHTENSHKYSKSRLEELFKKTPWRLDRFWTDEKAWYAACLLSNS